MLMFFKKAGTDCKPRGNNRSRRTAPYGSASDGPSGLGRSLCNSGTAVSAGR
jgi:hypothetical protein